LGLEAMELTTAPVTLRLRSSSGVYVERELSVFATDDLILLYAPGTGTGTGTGEDPLALNRRKRAFSSTGPVPSTSTSTSTAPTSLTASAALAQVSMSPWGSSGSFVMLPSIDLGAAAMDVGDAMNLAQNLVMGQAPGTAFAEDGRAVSSKQGRWSDDRGRWPNGANSADAMLMPMTAERMVRESGGGNRMHGGTSEASDGADPEQCLEGLDALWSLIPDMGMGSGSSLDVASGTSTGAREDADEEKRAGTSSELVAEGGSAKGAYDLYYAPPASFEQTMRSFLLNMPFDAVDIWVPLYDASTRQNRLHFGGGVAMHPGLQQWVFYSQRFCFHSGQVSAVGLVEALVTRRRLTLTGHPIDGVQQGMPGRVFVSGSPEYRDDVARLDQGIFLRQVRCLPPT
jgi:hypothetical protein